MVGVGGVRADAVMGHSQGEVAAVYVAGGLSLEDAVRVVVARSRLISDQLTGAGAMASVALPAEKVAERLARYGQAVCVAAVNGPAAVVVSGDPDAVQRFVDDCARDGIRASHVAVDYASHSRHVEALREPLLRELADIVPRPAAIPFYSTVTGEETDTLGVDAEYWFGNLRRPVRFAEAVAAAADDGHTVFVEVGPHPLLTPGITAVLDERRGDTAAADTHPAGAVVGSLRRGDGGLDRLLRSAAHLHITGVAVDWSALFEESGVQRVSLPTYAFQHRRYWLDPTEAADPVALGVTGAAHPLLAAVVADPGTGGATLTGLISLRSQPWLADHAVSETVLFPGTGFLELALRAGAEVDTPAVAELTLLAPLVLRAEEAVTIRVVVGAAENGLRPITIHGRVVDHGDWVRHAAGTLARDIAGTEDGSVPAPASAAEIDVDDLYDRLTALGCEYGPTFRGLRAVRRTGSDLYIDAALPHSASGARRYGVHPALLDAVLQAAVCLDTESEHAVTPLLPFTWTGVTRFATGATALRARIGRDTDTGALTLAVSDTAGRAVLSVRALTTRPVRLDLAATATVRLHTPIWKPAPVPPVQQPVSSMVWPEAVAAIEDGMDNPAVVVLDCRGRTTGTDPHAPVHEVLAVLQRFVTDERFTGSRLVVLTCGAVSVAGEDVTDLSGAAVWGLARSGQSEHPGRIVLADIGTAPDDVADVDEALAAVVSSADAEPQFAVRSGVVHVPRLTVPPADLLEPPASGIWRLDCPAPGTPDGLALTPHESAEPTLRAGQVQVGVRAAGLNFRDVMICLGVYPDPDVALGAEISGVVLAVGAGVDDIARGDRVMGLITGGIGPVAVTDHRSLVQVPPGWSFADAAATPVAFATAWYGLCDLAEVGPGDRVLIHAATGGVGMAALQLARLWGAEVFATASRGKWHILRELGFDDDHIGDSRGLDFAQQFLAATDGAGMDVVLDCLAGEFVDASLRLLPRGGRFVEMGKTDIRDPGEIAAEYPGVRYRAFDLLDAGSDRIGRILGDLFDLFIDGRLHRLPLRAWDIRQAPAAFRCFAQTRHTGKLVLTLPPAPTLEHGTVLVTGGTGGLGGVVARHLATRYQPRLLVLAGRRGPRAPGAEELARDLTALGTEVRVVACDVSDRAAVADLLASIPAHAPLTGIVHAAGVLDDGVIDSLTPERVSAVLAAKADAARHLHELTRAHDLTLFVLFSSAVGVLGSPGQGNYAAANSMVDALAAHRRAQGLVATSIAWGNWASVTAMTARLGAADTARMHRAGVAALDTEQGLALFDAAVTRAQATVAAVRFDRPALTAAARAGTLPPILRDLVTVGPRPASAPETSAQDLRRRLAGLPESEQRHELLNLVCSHTAAVLGHTHPHAIDPHRTFADHGIDSLTAVETRNRLTTTT
ncbi:hypothetical protein B0T36_25630, partial [Nocardia donostiensis]|uniref:SDR family NAD(P)-dependent oxidoreductase n=1 Tax=Nocardia donostiensis TaxID=1538463 RepID=UPI0009EF9F9C